MKSTFLIVALVVLVSGCATAVTTIRYQTSGTLEDLLNARQECANELAGSGGAEGTGGYVSAAPGCSAFTQCVERKGHVRDPNGTLILPQSAVIACTPP
ncbi:MAG: hypothetical protein WD558_06800 [Pseudomonadales bacterium]